jgi:multiple sugar transport system permease protein
MSSPTLQLAADSRVLELRRAGLARRWRSATDLGLTYGGLILACAAAFVPFLYLVSLSLKQTESLVTYPPQWIPNPVYLGNYELLISQPTMGRWAVNTMVVASAVTLAKLVIDSVAGYAFAKVDFPFKEPLFLIALALMMIPVAATLIPTYLFVRGLGLLNTYWGLILPGLASPFGIFLMRQFMETLPRDLENAARLDGASEWYIYARIILPLCKPALVVLAIYTFMAQWVAFVWPLVITNTEDMRVLTVGIYSLRGIWAINWGLVAAGMVVIVLPTVAVFVGLQRYFIAGSLVGAIKQ